MKFQLWTSNVGLAAIVLGVTLPAMTGDQEPKMQVYSIRQEWTAQGAALSPDGRYLAVEVERSTGSGEVSLANVQLFEDIQIWDFREQKLLARRTLSNRNGATPLITEERYVRYGGGGQTLVVYDGNVLHVLHADTLEEIRRIDLGLPPPSRESHLDDLEIDEKSGRVAALISWGLGQGGAVHVYDLDTGQLIRQWKFDEQSIVNTGSLAWEPGGDRLAVTLLYAIPGRRHPRGVPNLLVLDVASGKITTRIDTGYVAGPVCFTSDNKILTASLNANEKWYKEDTIKVWDAQSGRLLREIDNLPAGVHKELDVSADGRLVLGYVKLDKYLPLQHYSELIYQKFRLWNLKTGEVIATSPEIDPNKTSNPVLRLHPTGSLVLVYSAPSSGAVIVFELE